jgi:hypothetical protein
MTERIDRNYWSELRKRLERDFGQEEIVIRAQPLDLLQGRGFLIAIRESGLARKMR